MYVSLVSIMVVCATNVLLLTTQTNCGLSMEVVPIIICGFFLLSGLTKVLQCKMNSQPFDGVIYNRTPWKQEQEDLLLDPAVEDQTCAGEVHKNMTPWAKCCRLSGGLSKIFVILFCLLNCAPLVLCAVWINTLARHSPLNNLKGTVCEVRYWYSVFQMVILTPISCCCVLYALFHMHRLCKQDIS